MAPVPGFSSLGKLHDDYDCFNEVLEVLIFVVAVASRIELRFSLLGKLHDD
jgi:hypothetical protein